MNEEEIRQLKELLLNLDRKLLNLDRKIDRLMEKVDRLVGESEAGGTPLPPDRGGWRVLDVDGETQMISWDLKEFDPEAE